jgi:hypothetical protein
VGGGIDPIAPTVAPASLHRKIKKILAPKGQEIFTDGAIANVCNRSSGDITCNSSATVGAIGILGHKKGTHRIL